MRHRLLYARNAPDGNGTLFRGDMYQVPMNGLLGGATGQRIWETNLVAQYSLGTRLVLGDGRVFRYAKASNIVTRSDFGVKFWALSSDGIEANTSQAQVVGDTSITLPTATAFAKDALRGGYVMIHIGAHFQNRGILGNDAMVGGSITIYLSEPLTVAVGAAQYTEVYPNPYSNVYCHYAAGGHPAGAFSSVAGVPFVITTVANTYIWIQTWGPLFINPYDHIGSDPDADMRIAVFDHEGAIAYDHEAKGFAADSASHHQHAGFIINRQTDSASGPPLLMLQISP